MQCMNEIAPTNREPRICVLNIYFVSAGIRNGFLLQYDTKEGMEYGGKIAKLFGLEVHNEEKTHAIMIGEKEKIQAVLENEQKDPENRGKYLGDFLGYLCPGLADRSKPRVIITVHVTYVEENVPWGYKLVEYICNASDDLGVRIHVEQERMQSLYKYGEITITQRRNIR